MLDGLWKMQSSCGNIMARAMVLNNSVGLNRKSSCDETGSIVAGGATLECCLCGVKSTWKLMLRKMRFLYKNGIK